VPSFSFPLSSLDAFRFTASRDVGQALTELGVTNRQQLADKLAIPVETVPDMADMTGPLYIEITCSGRIDDHPDHPAWLQAGPCQQAATRISVMGCVHEHFVPAPLCGGCIQRALRMDTMWCGLCRDAGADVPLSEITLNRLEHVDRFLMQVLMYGVTEADEWERQRIEAFVIEHLDDIVAPHLREPIGEEFDRG
jgi:hypothetical protein